MGSKSIKYTHNARIKFGTYRATSATPSHNSWLRPWGGGFNPIFACNMENCRMGKYVHIFFKCWS